jgi:hypothetical protein
MITYWHTNQNTKHGNINDVITIKQCCIYVLQMLIYVDEIGGACSSDGERKRRVKGKVVPLQA